MNLSVLLVKKLWTIMVLSLSGTVLSMFLDETEAKIFPPPCVMGDESIMKQKAHGTSETPVQSNLRWDVDRKLADKICNYNRHYAENGGYWETRTKFLDETKKKNTKITFYDSNTGRPLFRAPQGRSMEEFLRESRSHGWPSFRDNEVVWENVRCLPDGETVSLAGTHLGHNLPDDHGSRYCINLVSIAGNHVSAKY